MFMYLQFDLSVHKIFSLLRQFSTGFFRPENVQVFMYLQFDLSVHKILSLLRQFSTGFFRPENVQVFMYLQFDLSVCKILSLLCWLPSNSLPSVIYLLFLFICHHFKCIWNCLTLH